MIHSWVHEASRENRLDFADDRTALYRETRCGSGETNDYEIGHNLSVWLSVRTRAFFLTFS
jgi:hypothetical protein